MAKSKLLPLATAVQRFTSAGIQYASGVGLPVGADPVVFGRELIRQNRRHLHAIFHCREFIDSYQTLGRAAGIDRTRPARGAG